MSAETIPADVLYLIRKGGLFYRPNSQGYTAHTFDAGRYTLVEAEAITHPNGPDGPRDGLSYVPAPADRSTRPAEPAAPVAEAGDGEVVAWEARFAEAVEIAQDKFAWKAPLEVVELQSDLLALLRDYASTLEAERARADAAEARIVELEAVEKTLRWSVSDSEASLAAAEQRAADALARAEKGEDWQPIETVPKGKNGIAFMMLSFGPPGDQTVSEGLHFNGRFYAASVFHKVNPSDGRHFVFREHEVRPTHWRPTLAPPRASREAQPATDGGDNG